jgi:DNA-binding beta-propeller fold protein YncE
MNPARPVCTSLLLLLAACGSSGGGNSGGGTEQDAGADVTGIDPGTWIDGLKENESCILNCDPKCTEAKAPWTCPALADWSAIPHDPAACGDFDGGFPAPVHGKCTVTAPSGQAAEKTNTAGTPPVLPDGRRIEPAGHEWVFDDFQGGFPDGVLLASPWLFIVDTGYTTHAVRVVDTGKLAMSASTTPVTSSIKYDPPAALNWGMAYVAASKVLYVASGYDSSTDANSQIFAYDFDTAAGKLAADAAKSVPLPGGTFPQGIAVSPDGSTLLVGQVTDSHVLVISLASATYGKVTGQVDVGQSDVFEIRFDPNDATGKTAYATLWISAISASDSSKMPLAQIDLTTMKSTTIAVGKEPEDMAFLDARYMVVANGFSDSLSIVDRPASKVAATVSLGTTGLEPTALAYDATRSRLYATLASQNAVEVFDVDDTKTPPVVTPAGRIPTSWWPTAVAVDPTSGTLYVTTGRAHGTPGLNTDGDNGTYLRGSVASVPYMDATALAAATTTAEGDANVQGFPGQPTVQCGGAPYDFPIPQKTTDGPSAVIKHVVFIERENKTFDCLFGDLPGVDGDKTLLLSPQHQSSIWANARKVATEFAHLDNYYSDAEQSIQGHYWDVFGRTSDVDERRWVVIWGRGEFSQVDAPGVSDFSAPLEGSIFSTLQGQGVTLDNDGELVGGLAFRNTRWPAGTSSTTVPDTIGGCYLAARARATCDMKQFTYAWLGNDHTFGASPGYPNPAIMMATNDEATGMLLDGISHSPEWASTLVMVIEDDPSTGQDHVDMHRSIALMASPWVKRGYVSHGHYDVSSLHKLFSHVFGKPYPNVEVANAALPLDMFTGTPDFAPFTYVPRTYTDDSCNKKGAIEAKIASKWDFRNPDEQPGLGAQLERMMRALK